MLYPPQQSHDGSFRTRKLMWILLGVIGILVAALIVVVIIFSTKSETSSVPFNPNIANGGMQSSQNTQTTLANSYTGNSMNRTAQQLGLDGSAKLKLQFTNKDPLALRGEIVVDGRNVGGTGLFEGSLAGDRVQLRVLPKDGVPSFQLTGTVRSDGSIDGVLTVPGSAGDIAQTGDWQLRPQQ